MWAVTSVICPRGPPSPASPPTRPSSVPSPRARRSPLWTSRPRASGACPEPLHGAGQPGPLGGENRQGRLQRLVRAGQDRARVAGGDGRGERVHQARVTAAVPGVRVDATGFLEILEVAQG